MASSSGPARTGTIDHAVAHLSLWSRRSGSGLARVDYSCEHAVSRCVQRLREDLTADGVAFHEFRLPTGLTPERIARLWIERLRAFTAGVVSVTGFAEAFTAGPGLEDELLKLNYYRERLAEYPLRQIWWMPADFADHFLRAAPDLNSWFTKRVRLEERVDEQTAALSDGKTEPAGPWWPHAWDTLRRPREPDSAGFAERAGRQLLGRPGEVLAAAQEAVEVRRALAGRDAGFRPALATALNHLVQVLVSLGRRGEALRPAREAVELHRAAAAEQNSAVFQPDLAMALQNLAIVLGSQGWHDEALAPALEAVGIYRALAGQDPEATAADLAGALSNLAVRLSHVGQREEALRTSQEAVGLYRQLAAGDPDAFEPDLARSLDNLAHRLSDLERNDEALGSAQEAVLRWRALSARDPDAFQPDLARSLSTLATRLGRREPRQEALGPAMEAIDMFRGLAARDPVAFRADLARALSNLAMHLGQLGRSDEAIEPATEAVGLFRSASGTEPADDSRPDLARALMNLAILLSEVGRNREALGPAQGAVDLFRALDSRNPDAFWFALALSLGVMGQVQERSQQSAEACHRLREAIQLLAPRFHARAAANSLMAQLVREYLRLAKSLGREPDATLLAPVLERLQLAPVATPAVPRLGK